MPIPDLTVDGLLPPGVHDCTFEEVERSFGGFNRTDRRPVLWEKFSAFHEEARKTGLVVAILINGSFVTAKPDPNDIDIIVVVFESHNFSLELLTAQYNVLSAQRVKRRHQLDMLVARENSEQYQRYLKLFEQVRFEPTQIKGILRINL